MNIKEILVLHHSHLDIGYTHSQQVLWRLQYDFIEQALKMMEKTAYWPEASKPRWTIEATAQINAWLEHASDSSIEAMQRCLDENRIGIAGMQYNTTPLCTLEELERQLEPIAELRKRFSCSIDTVIQHDVNGTPWTMADLLPAHGIKTLVMGINPHLGGAAAGRPSLFRWVGPAGHEVLVLNGEHYTMFDQQLRTSEGTLDAMQRGFERYISHLEKIGYEQDFLYLTSSNIPVCWDNSPPNMEVAELIRASNEAGVLPPIRYVTPNDISLKMESLYEKLPVLQGDWSDFWNFGCASSAYETAINQRTKSVLFEAELLHALADTPPPIVSDALKASWQSVILYDEHTWGCDESMDTTTYNTRAQWYSKAINAYQGREQAFFSLIAGLEQFSGNPEQGQDLQGIMLCNFTGKDRRVPVAIPKKWNRTGKQLSTARYRADMQATYMRPDAFDYYQNVEVPAYGWLCLPFSELDEEQDVDTIESGQYIQSTTQTIVSFDLIEPVHTYRDYISSPYHRIEFDRKTGRITSVFDRIGKRELLDTESRWTFFQLIREIPDPLIDPSRQAFYQRDYFELLDDNSCWKPDWKARRDGPDQFLGHSVSRTGSSITLELRFALQDIEDITQRITLYSDHSYIDLSLSMTMHDYTAPESFYLCFPLSLPEGWNAEYTSADTKVRLDEQQLPGSSKGWITTQSTASIFNEKDNFTLISPDAPMVLFGDFNFGRALDHIERKKNPLLLSWPLTNYWETNFRASQPSFVSFSYRVSTGSTCPDSQEVKEYMVPTITHPLVNCGSRSSGRYFTHESDGDVDIISVRRGEEENSILFRLVNKEGSPASSWIRLDKDMIIEEAHTNNRYGPNTVALKASKNGAHIVLDPYELVNLTLTYTRKKT
jgi:hypothetical protein